MSVIEKFADIHTFIFDVDGVLTDGSVYIQEDGTLLRKMNTRDGMAIQMAINAGFEIIIITGGNSIGVIKRLQGLGVSRIHTNAHDKLAVLQDLVAYENLDLARTLYMGDDVNDYACLRAVHISTCPNDAASEIKSLAQYISPFAGGTGCVRDIIERVLRLQQKWKFPELNKA
jgi:3-deoxy-D-manno-octulosonate 8-phosphate phosphatase (KDO 8-P phosphatase)